MAVAEPLLPPKQLTFWLTVTEIVKTGGCEIVALAFALQLFLSVTVTPTVPAERLEVLLLVFDVVVEVALDHK